MSATQTGPIPKDHSTALTEQPGVVVHAIHRKLPVHRTVAQALERAELLEQQLHHRVLPFQEDWDLVILAQEVRRLRRRK